MCVIETAHIPSQPFSAPDNVPKGWDDQSPHDIYGVDLTRLALRARSERLGSKAEAARYA
jgi:hypothetical protein